LSQFYLYDKDEFLTSMLRSQMQDKQQLFYEKGSLLENYWMSYHMKLPL